MAYEKACTAHHTESDSTILTQVADVMKDAKATVVEGGLMIALAKTTDAEEAKLCLNKIFLDMVTSKVQQHQVHPVIWTRANRIVKS